jgi:Zn-dependent protease with chaperone function
VLTVLLASAGLAVLWAVTMLAFGYLVQHVPLLEVAWCRPLFRHHDHVPTTLGVGSLSVLMVMGVGAWRARRRYRRLASLPGDKIEILPTMTPMAVALPGPSGRIVVSTGMLRCLEADELRVLFAHEEAHVRHRHDRFLAVADLVATALPLLRPIFRQLQHSTERWADETAATELGDRQLVARAIARAALATNDAMSAPAQGMATSGVVARVEALRRPVRINGVSLASWFAAGSTALTVAAVSSTVQLHHLVAFALHIC